jgi:hypothetical protein
MATLCTSVSTYKKLLCASLLLCSAYAGAQQNEYAKAQQSLKLKGEVAVWVYCPGKSAQSVLTKQSSIARIKGDSVLVFVNANQFETLAGNYAGYRCFDEPQQLDQKAISATYFYPNYQQYCDSMKAFASQYPDICTLDTIGYSASGRVMLQLHITGPGSNANERAGVALAASIHGNEPVSYTMMLHLADSLLTGYSTSARIKNLVDNLNLYILPAGNPDGLFYVNDAVSSVSIRYNKNGVDLNRNFPDPDDGMYPDGNAWQPETQAIMNFAKTHAINLSINFHSGSEVVNYPWDTWQSAHPDDIWFKQIAKEYADTVKKYGPSRYFSDVTTSGIINGYDWYEVNGGRQDYMTYFAGSREITVEVSESFWISPASTLLYWNYNKQAILNYIELGLSAIKGKVTDAVTGKPVYATVSVEGRSAALSAVHTNSATGVFYRFIEDGNWTLRISADGYNDTLVQVTQSGLDKSVQTQNCKLTPWATSIGQVKQSELSIYPNPVDDVFTITGCTNGSLPSVKLYNLNGTLVWEGRNATSYSISAYLPKGLYIAVITCGNKVERLKLIKRL